MSRLRVVALNLASGRGRRGQALGADDLTAALAPLRDLAPDVVALSEVDTGQERSGHLDQAALVAQALGMAHWRSAPALLGTPGPQRTWRPAGGLLHGPGAPGTSQHPRYGIALLSRAPVASWAVLPLAAGRARLPLLAPDPVTGRLRGWTFPDEPRVALAAVIGERGLVAATHLSFAPVTARRQLSQVRRWLAGMAAPDGVRLLAGDLNLPPLLLPRGLRPLARAATFPAHSPRLQLDHVLDLADAPLPAADGRAVELVSGDHRALVVDVVLPAPPAPPSAASS